LHTVPQPVCSRDELRRQWQEHADALFERLFPADQAQPLPSFDQLEKRTVQLARDLASWLLQQRSQDAAHARPAQPPTCPRCGQQGRRVGAADAPLSRRVLRRASLL
jgi:hypothetical protein